MLFKTKSSPNNLNDSDIKFIICPTPLIYSLLLIGLAIDNASVIYDFFDIAVSFSFNPS